MGRSDFPRSQLFIYFYFCFISDNYGDIQGSRFFDSGWGMVDMGVEGEMSSFFVPRGPAGLRAGGPSTALREEESKNREADGTADLADWAAAKLGFEPDAVQRDLLSAGGRRLILNCTRQWGKSTVTAAKAVHTAYSREGSLTLV